MGTTLLSGVGRVSGPVRRTPSCSRAARDGDPAAREELVRRFLPMARRLAWRYRRGGEPADDLVQVASLALVKAIERFDPRRGVPFSGYAVPTIVGELKRHLRDTRWAAYVPQRMRERVLEVDRAAESLRLRARPLADRGGGRRMRLGSRSAEVADALEAATAYEAVSLDSPAYGSQADDAGATCLDSLGADEERYDMVEYAVTIEPGAAGAAGAPAGDPAAALPART